MPGPMVTRSLAAMNEDEAAVEAARVTLLQRLTEARERGQDTSAAEAAVQRELEHALEAGRAARIAGVESPVPATLSQLRAQIEFATTPPTVPSFTLDTLPPSVSVLTSPHGGTVYLIGTAHVSAESEREVAELVALVKPQAVALELCRARTALLLPQSPSSPSSKAGDGAVNAKSVWRELLAAVREGGGTDGVFHKLLAHYVAQVSSKVNVPVGAEIRAGFLEARRVGARVVLADRLITLTLRRAWAALSTARKLKLLYMMLTEEIDVSAEDIEQLKKADMLEALVEELRGAFPELVTYVMEERDLYLTAMIRNIPADSVVAVVGMGHVRGIKQAWGSEIDMRALNQAPAADGFKLHLKLLLSALAGTAVAGVVALGYGARWAYREMF